MMQRKRSAPNPFFIKGGTLIGFMLGLVLGLGVAVVVAIFVTRAPVPFVNKTNKAAERVQEGRANAEKPDPNKPMYSKAKPSSAPAGDSSAAPPASGGSVLGDILSKDNTPPPSVAIAPPASPLPSASKDPINDAIKTPSKDAATDPNAAVIDKTTYQLQAGAFRQEDEALSMQAKLALLGYESRVINAQVKGESIYRVRVGPYKQLDDMNKARGRMAENKIDVTVIKITPAN